jgi:hypothetical protein
MKTAKVSEAKLQKTIRTLVARGTLRPVAKRILREHHVAFWDRFPTAYLRKMMRPGWNGSSFGPKRNRDAAMKSLNRRERKTSR